MKEKQPKGYVAVTVKKLPLKNFQGELSKSRFRTIGGGYS